MAKPKIYNDAILIRVTKAQKADFVHACIEARENPTQVIRDLMKHYCDLLSPVATKYNEDIRAMRDTQTINWVDNDIEEDPNLA